MLDAAQLHIMLGRIMDPSIRSVIQSALQGDQTSALVAADIAKEMGFLDTPFEIGKSYLICEVTLYYVGRVKLIGFGWMELEQASWVHWTGRLSALLAAQSFTARSLSTRKPRVEPCGTAFVWFHALVSAYPWIGELPSEPVQ